VDSACVCDSRLAWKSPPTLDTDDLGAKRLCQLLIFRFRPSSGMTVLCQVTTDLKNVTPHTIPRTQTLTLLRKGPRCNSDSRPRRRQSSNRQNLAGVQAWCCRSEYKASLWRAGKRASLDLTDSFQNTSSETFWSDSTASPRRSREKLSDCLRFSWRFKYDFLHSSNSDWFTK